MNSAGIIAIANQKGGSGKTTTTLNLGVALGDLGYQVLLIDLDPQASLTYSVGHQSEEGEAERLYQQGELPVPIELEEEGVDMLSASLKLASLELRLAQMPDREFILRAAVHQYRDQYDFILMDCPPSLTLGTINALCAADAVLIPVPLDVLSVKGLTVFLETLESLRDSLHEDLVTLAAVPMMLDSRKNITQELQDFLHQLEGLPVTAGIRSDVKVAEAPSFGKSVIRYAPRSRASQDFLALAKHTAAAMAEIELSTL